MLQRFAPLLFLLGILVMGFGGLMLVPLTLSWVIDDGAHSAYDEAVLITVLTGALLAQLGRRHRRELRVRDSFLLVVLVWSLLPAFAALPLYFQIKGLSWTDAYFEAVSGLTATGATVLSGLDHLPLSINFWRTFLHWIGGLGVVVLAVAILPLLGFGGRSMLKAETPGPMKDSKITPRLAETAKGLWVVYVLLTLACTLALQQVGMETWDALLHAFSIMGLGGFSTKDASLGHFNSLEIELVVVFFALLAGINFSTHFLVLSQRSLRAYRFDVEAHYFLGFLAISSVALAVYLWPEAIYDDFLSTLRYVAFHSVSLATSLGFATTDYAQWPIFAQLWLLFLGSFVACSGSAGGGIKMMRAVILYKQVSRELMRAMHPRGLQTVRFGTAVVPDHVLHAILGFLFIYVVSIVSLTFLLIATKLDVITAFSAVVACLNNTGPGLNLVGPATTYAVLSDFQTWVCSWAMLLGRLEIFTLLVVLVPAFWRR
ncbi:MAG TPA: potassium transporter TrkG [Accumulibacter sp.]|uniref:TrkH family potassium uptake protein n=1 Tax=Accumulibacter sp. TaxID=2053492 RepID=UPI002C37295B|nr:potassium transporter TrkG [Accumulibacter sp.]HMV03938.1 potassium transporter TrkG [Accumulibacter sp.]HMW79411.1 potassium transporter TrkG [Accumulibacter sp.]HNE39593.1 potassium transporter TrkG [Accumulibacter sp.]